MSEDAVRLALVSVSLGGAVMMLAWGVLRWQRTASARAQRQSLGAEIFGFLQQGFFVLQGLKSHSGSRRLKRLEEAMPEICDLLAASLRSGLSLHHSLAQIAPRLQEPAQSEVREILNANRRGLPLDQAVNRFAERAPVRSVQLFSYCLQMSMQSGGGLSEALLRLGQAIRKQLALEAKIAALTAQGRLQAGVMLCIPPLLLLAMCAIDPQAADFYFGSWKGWVLLLGVILLEVLGALWIRKIVNIEV